MLNTATPEATKSGGQEQTSYVSPGQEIADYYKSSGPSAPNVTQPLENSHFLNAAILLAEYLGGASFEEAVKMLLVAKATNPNYDFGALAGLSGKTTKVKESLERNKHLIKEAVKHSVENKIHRLISALNGVREQFDAKEGWVFPIATLAKHAIVVNSEGDLFRAHYDESDGDIKIVKTEKFSTEVKRESFDRKLDSAVQALLEGKKGKISVSLKDLLSHSPGSDDTEFAKARFQSLMHSIRAESFWKGYVRENSAKIRVFVRGGLNELNNTGIRPRFQKLSLKGMDGKLSEQFKKSVREGLQNILAKLSKMRDEVSESFTRDQWLINSLSSYNKEIGHQASGFISRFIGDYVNSLTTVVDGVRLSLGESDLPFQALLYDTLAEEYPAYALGYLFARKVLSDLKLGIS